VPRPPADVERIDLGLRLNHLLDQGTLLGKSNPDLGGLILPAAKEGRPRDNEGELGSGVVVIIGEPGSGKSTLALQIAVAAAEQGYDSAYLSLEEEPERVRKKARIFGWN